MKRRVGIIIIVVALLVIIGCAGSLNGSRETPDKPSDKANPGLSVTEVPSPTAEPTPTAVPTPTTEPSPTTEPTPTAVPTPTTTPAITGEVSREITWGLYGWNRPDEAAQEKINQLLAEKGYDFTIRFVKMGSLTDDEIVSWLKDDSPTGGVDIMNAGAWSTPQAANEFAETYFTKINDLLTTENGQELRALWSKGAWDRVTAGDGSVYAIPRINTKTAASDCFNAGIYITVPEEYREYFSKFDGTYQSLREIIREIGNQNVFVELSCGFTDRLLNALMGYQDYAGIPYDPKTNRFVNLAKSNALSELLEMLQKDMEQGILVRTASPTVFGDDGENNGGASEGTTERKRIGVIHDGITEAPEGFFEVCLAEDPYYYNCALSYGISAGSAKKELAAYALYVCFTDPDIAVLLTPDSADFVRSAERLEITAAESAGKLTGFEKYELAAGCPAVCELTDPWDPVLGYARLGTKVLEQLSNTDYTKSMWGTFNIYRGDFVNRIAVEGKAAQAVTMLVPADGFCEVVAATELLWVDSATGICGKKLQKKAFSSSDGDKLFACLQYEFAKDDSRRIAQLSSSHEALFYFDKTRDEGPQGRYASTWPVANIVE